MKRLKGFTLIELMAVIAIISILATYVIIRIGTSSVDARNNRRVADLQMVTTAIKLFKNDGGHIKKSGAEGNLQNDQWHQDQYFYVDGDVNGGCYDSSACPNKYMAGSIYPDDPNTGEPYFVSTDANGTVHLRAPDAEQGETVETSV